MPVGYGGALAGIRRSEIGGEFLAQQFLLHLEEQAMIDTTPQYYIASKKMVNEGETPKYVRRKDAAPLTPSFERYLRMNMARDLQACVGRLYEQEYDETTIMNIPTTSYDFPTGGNYAFGVERYTLTECLFKPAVALVSTRAKAVDEAQPPPDPRMAKGCPQVILSSIGVSDVEIRQVSAQPFRCRSCLHSCDVFP
eukprot:m.140682 g.140682  ORF g.140682 m.140682 type:complete len:196 (-) comp52579_c0_seq1:336-923(-)